jgi:tetratricopeptide (TPR) repeat protein
MIPFLFLSFILGFVTLWFQYNKAIGNEIVRDDSFLSRMAVSAKAIWFYIYKALVPINLSFVYPRWNIEPLYLTSFIYFILLIIALILLWRKRESWGRGVFFGLLYFIITLLPVLGFFNIYFMKFSLVADHWQYFSTVGIIVPITAIISKLYLSFKQREGTILCFFVFTVFLIFTTLTYNQCKIYSDGIALYSDIILKNSFCWMAYNNRGQLYERKNLNEEAMTDFTQAIKIKEDYFEAYFNRGILFEKTGKPDFAILDYTKSLTNNPSYYNAFYNRGLLLAKAEKIDLAISDFINVIRLNPKFNEAYSNRGILYGLQGKFEEALADFNTLVRMNPNNVTAYINRGIIYGRKGDYELAISDFDKAISMDPYEKIAYINRSFALDNQNNHKEALRDCLKAVELGYPVESGYITKLYKLAKDS